MIPASYLYKDAYRQNWGDDFARKTADEPWDAHLDNGHWTLPGPFGGLAALLRRLSGAGEEASEAVCPDAMVRRYV